MISDKHRTSYILVPLFQLVESTGLSQTAPVETPLTATANTPSMR